MGKTKTKSRSVGDSPKPPITIRSTNPKILDDNIAKLEKAIQASDVSANPSGTAEETLLSTIGIDGKKYDLGPSAENTSYDNTDSGLTATDTQAAIDEAYEKATEATTFTITAEEGVSITRQVTKKINNVVYFSCLFVVTETTTNPLSGFVKPAGVGNDAIQEVICVIPASGTLIPALINNAGALNARGGGSFTAGNYTVSSCYITD